MKRFARRALFVVLSLLLGVTVAMWARSYDADEMWCIAPMRSERSIGVGYGDVTPRLCAALSSGNVILYHSHFKDVPAGKSTLPFFSGTRSPPGGLGIPRRRWVPWISYESYEDTVGSGAVVVRHRLVVSHAFIVLLLVAALLGRPAWIGIVQARRAQRGLCLACGYDLRASPGRCPECGWAAGDRDRG